ncbi:MAG TPA: hypothetical protein VJ461_06150 [Candidatus Nanoarchaeia archaeon]|nr:hypothetical protein [Candidatus Nanoarchaeia archaeon]
MRMRVRLLVYVLVLILISINAQAIGISYQYMENDTLKLYPGQTYMFRLTVQNKDEEEVKVSIAIDSAIATLVGGSELKVPAKNYDTYVLFNITVPEKAQVGDVYNINYLVSPVGKGEGQVPLAVRYDRGFRVLVVEKPKEPGEEQQPAPVPEKKPSILKWVLIPLALIIIIVLVVLLWNKSHQMSGRIMKKEPVLRAPRHEIKPERALMPEEPIIPPKPRAIIPEPQQPEEPAQEALPAKQEKVIIPHHHFHLRNGQSLKNLNELYSALKTMSQDEFSHHVNPYKNDFANWVAHILEKQELASKLFRAGTKQEMLELIKNELEQN